MVTVLARLRDATDAELGALAAALEIELPDAREEQLVRVMDAYGKAARSTDYRAALKLVAKEAARKAHWPKPVILDATKDEWIEDYIYESFGLIHDPEKDALTSAESGARREAAQKLLRGESASPEERVWQVLRDSTEAFERAAVVGGAIVGGAVGLAALGLRWWFFSPTLRKLVPATLLLVHVRKRMEYEGVVGKLREKRAVAVEDAQ